MFLFPSDANTEIMPRESRWEETWHASQRDPCKQRHHNRPTLTPGLEDCGYLANVYPKEHARWRCEGRLLVFCAESSGLGSFMLAFPAAVVASILTERALILECPFDHQAAGISNRIGRFFRGANSIDWSAKGLHFGDTRCYPANTRSCVANKTVPQVHVPRSKTPRYWYSRDMVQGHKVEGKVVGFHASEHTSIDKVLRGGSQAGSGAIIQGTLDNITNHFKFPSPCVSRTFFQPTDTLLGLQQRVVPAGMQLSEALNIAQAIAAQAPMALVATRQNVLKAVEEGPLVAMHEFITVQKTLSNSEDAKEGVQSFIEKRAAKFTGK